MFADLLLGQAYRGEPSDLDMLGHLRQARDAMAAGVPVPADAARHLVKGFDRYLSGQSQDLAKALGLRPCPGQKNPVTKRVRLQRDEDVVKLYNELEKHGLLNGNKGKLIAAVVEGQVGNDIPEIRSLAESLRSAPLSARRYAEKISRRR